MFVNPDGAYFSWYLLLGQTILIVNKVSCVFDSPYAVYRQRTSLYQLMIVGHHGFREFSLWYVAFSACILVFSIH